MNKAILLGIALLTALNAFDELVLLIALPDITADIGGEEWYGQMIAAYIIASIAGLIIAGRDIDRRGPRHAFYLACSTFGLGLIIAVFAQNAAQLLFARILQGFGGGMAWTIAYALIALFFENKDKARAISVMDLAFVIPSLMAPLVGGFFVEHWHWRWIFAVQFIPLFTLLYLLRPHLHSRAIDHSIVVRQTLWDAFIIVIASGLFFYVLALKIDLWWLSLAPLLWLALPAYNRHLPTQWWRAKSAYALGISTTILLCFAFYLQEAFMPLYLIQEKNISSILAGLLLSAASISWMAGSHLQARRKDRDSATAYALIGAICLLIGLTVNLVVVFYDLHKLILLPAWAVFGLGMGLSFSTIRSELLSHAAKGSEGRVATAISLSASLGIALATGIGGAIKNQMQFVGARLSDTSSAALLLAMALTLITISLFWRHLRRRTLSSISTF